MKSKQIALAALSGTAALIIFLCAITAHPPIFGKDGVSEEYLHAISAQSSGLYSEKLPLVPLFVTVEGFSGDRIFYTIHYLPLGTVTESYSKSDGYNTEKYLTNF